jgi:hypothetical protein
MYILRIEEMERKLEKAFFPPKFAGPVDFVQGRNGKKSRLRQHQSKPL